jgi:3'-phosphoadenosine 5'-phosphosulfate sulfotransferase (PAPS reductase)/FAD synthetase
MQALALSGGKDSLCCLFLMRDQLDCAVYVDTGYAYPETRDLVNFASTLLPVHVVQSDRKGQNKQAGIPSDVVPVDWTEIGQKITGSKPVKIQSYLQCCWENVSAPLLAKAKALGVTHLVYGQRNDERHKSVARHGTVVEGITRVHPIEDWTAQQVLDYLATQMDVPAHFTLNHSSLDCYDCPSYERDSQDRLAWTKERYPGAYAAYAVRRSQLDEALQEALCLP